MSKTFPWLYGLCIVGHTLPPEQAKEQEKFHALAMMHWVVSHFHLGLHCLKQSESF